MAMASLASLDGQRAEQTPDERSADGGIFVVVIMGREAMNMLPQKIDANPYF